MKFTRLLGIVFIYHILFIGLELLQRHLELRYILSLTTDFSWITQVIILLAISFPIILVLVNTKIIINTLNQMPEVTTKKIWTWAKAFLKSCAFVVLSEMIVGGFFQSLFKNFPNLLS